MQKPPLRIAFMGTPDFAKASLSKMIDHGLNVVAVVTVPDKPTGRGQQLSESAVKKYAIEKNLPLLQPEKLKNETFLENLAAFNADLFVVVAFRMLPEAVWSMPEHGTINLHGSLLPNYRGAAPIHWAVINGETTTGVTTFFIEKDIDTGNIIFSESIEIGPSENTGSVHDRLMEVGADLIIKTVEAITNGTAPAKKQIATGYLKHAPKIFKETAQIDWNQPTEIVYNFIRGMCPFPSAWTIFNGLTLKIFEASMATDLAIEDHSPGQIYTDQKQYIYFKTKDGWVKIEELQLEGKKRLKTEAFLRGYRFT